MSTILSFPSLAAATTRGTYRHFLSGPLSPCSLPAHYLQDSLKHNQMKPLSSFKTPISPSRTHSLLPITTSLQFNPRRPLPPWCYKNKIIIFNVLCCFTHSGLAHTVPCDDGVPSDHTTLKRSCLFLNSQFKCFLLLSSAEIIGFMLCVPPCVLLTRLKGTNTAYDFRPGVVAQFYNPISDDSYTQVLNTCL